MTRELGDSNAAEFLRKSQYHEGEDIFDWVVRLRELRVC